MFSKLFTPKLQHPDPEKRLAAIKDLTASDQDIGSLSDLALNDPELKVRQQALEHLGGIMNDHSKLDATAAVQLFDVATYSIKEKLIAHIKDETQLQNCISNADNERDLLLLASRSVFPASRKSAAEKITGFDTLKQLQSQCNDKNVLQLVRKKINELKDLQKAEQAANETLNQICETLERLSTKEFDPMIVSRIKILGTHWEKIDEKYKNTFRDRYEKADKRCHQIIHEARERQALADFEQAQNQLCQVICETFESEIEQLTIETIDQWPKAIENVEQQWNTTIQNFNPAVQITERFHLAQSAVSKIDKHLSAYQKDSDNNILESASQQDMQALSVYEKRLFGISRQLDWPFSIKQPALFDQIKQQHRQIKSLLGEKQKIQKNKLGQIDKRVSILKSHIRQKNLIKANRILNFIENLIDELPDEIGQKEQDKIQPVIVSLNELRGLSDFITQPKKLELCEQMEALVNKKIEPEKLLDEIKGIQIKWKSLATSDAQADDVLWERFKQAADAAYIPCAAYLEKLENLKNENLKARQQLNEQLEQRLNETDWEHIDWKQIQAMYSQYWKKWRSLTPVFFSKNKAVQKHFEALTTVIKDKLDAEKNENHQLYDQLIERASQIVESLTDDNIEEAIEKIKRLQTSWKNIGITHFNKSNKQWTKFRKCCDQVFDYQRSKFKTKRLEENQLADQAYALINKIKALIKLPDSQFASSQDQFQTIIEQYSSIEDIPENLQQKIQRDFERTSEDYQSHLDGLAKRNKSHEHILIRQAAQLCCKAESLVMAGCDNADFDIVKSDYDSININKSVSGKLGSRINAAACVLNDGVDFDLAECEKNELMLSELAVKLEVLFDLETPEYAVKQRMNYQLEQLQLGIKPALTAEQKMKLLTKAELDWYTAGAVSIDARNALEQRLAAVIKQAEN